MEPENTKSNQEVFMGSEIFSMGIEMQNRIQGPSEKKAKVGGKRSFRMLLALLEAQGYLCALTGVRLEVETAELDHKVPVSRGGTNDLSNLQWVHKSINRAKGTMTNEEFVEACVKVAEKQGWEPPQTRRYSQKSLF
jgi:5-methylcytosine-specific restriction endonuclease McrA